MNLQFKRLLFDLRHYLELQILHTALQFGLFDLLKKKHLNSDEVALNLKTNKKATQIFLNALVAIGLLKKQSSRYENVKSIEKYLIRISSFYIGDIIRLRASRWKDWDKLNLCIKKGIPAVSPFNARTKNRKQFKGLILGMHNLALFDAPLLAKRLSLSRARRLIDIGGGSGIFSIFFAKRNPKLKCFILDLPEAAKIARRLICSHNLSNRVEVIEGNYNRRIEGKYDVAFLSKIIQQENEGDNRSLMKRVFECLNKGGKIILRDPFLNRGKTYPVESAIFSLYMFLHRKHAQCYSFAEIKQWLKKAGFSKIKKLRINLWDKSSLVVAEKRKEHYEKVSFSYLDN